MLISIKDFKTGETAYKLKTNHRGDGNEIVPCTIERVGRLYVYVTGWVKPSREGYEVRNPNATYLVEKTEFGAPDLLFHTRKDAEEYIERGKLEHYLYKCFSWDNVRKYSLEQLRSVKIILEGDVGCGQAD